ncbi:Hsp70 family protein [Rhodopirellula sp. JC740]|uniref:Hsp70 family protein n=1 Tax=Rhodopirellula halodulae TaxID=2894198 RepID=A0ABS8NIW6_9BACT|nr:Hsp70 family protein [Rhodopirellula sp. JC740]MCC9643485.1 Hsp70 family protein [Rhodopirellula sp. JC740]
MSDHKYCIGIDLGTTNSVVAYTRQSEGEKPSVDQTPEIQLLPIPQVVASGQVESRTSLPSFLYLPRDQEVDSLEIHHEHARFPSSTDGVAGVYAKQQAADNPQRVIVAAKSWLCQRKIDPESPVLPWQSPDEIPRVSAVECTEIFLRHLVAAWHAEFPEAPIGEQQVVLTVPASFDPAARELTRRAAIRAGLDENFVLLEEPQAAVYRYLASTEGRWRKSLSDGDTMLVVDVGGGTTDLTLIGVEQRDGELMLQRVAVGNHLLVGGDNMDLALAYQAAEQFRQSGHDLDPWQSTSLWHACREAKERLLANDGPESHPISVLGRGSSLIGGTITTELQKTAAASMLLDGFFPQCSAQERPQANVASGFQDVGLPFESDPAITKHIAAFLTDQSAMSPRQDGDGNGPVTHLLLNGGVFRSPAMQERLQTTLSSWTDAEIDTLSSEQDLDNAVAIGAAYYGWTKTSGGIRIRGGTAKAFYIGIETAGMAIPGAPRPLRAVCVAAQGMEEGTQAEVPGQEVGVVVGTPARFRFFSSTTRPQDTPGVRLDRWSPTELQESEPIELTLDQHRSRDEDGGGEPAQSFVPVQFESRVTELGMFELWCHDKRGDRRWKLEFNARQEDA